MDRSDDSFREAVQKLGRVSFEDGQASGYFVGLPFGRKDGLAHSIRAILKARGIPATAAELDRIASVIGIETLERWLNRAMKVASAEELVQSGITGDRASGPTDHHADRPEVGSRWMPSQQGSGREPISSPWRMVYFRGREDGVFAGIEVGRARAIEEAIRVVAAARGLDLSCEQSARLAACRDYVRLDRWLMHSLEFEPGVDAFDFPP